MRNVLSTDLKSITTEDQQRLFLDGKDAELIKNKRTLIIDDVISTGNSLAAVESLVLAAGSVISGKAAVLAEGDAALRGDIIFLERLPLFNENEAGLEK